MSAIMDAIDLLDKKLKAMNEIITDEQEATTNRIIDALEKVQTEVNGLTKAFVALRQKDDALRQKVEEYRKALMENRIEPNPTTLKKSYQAEHAMFAALDGEKKEMPDIEVLHLAEPAENTNWYLSANSNNICEWIQLTEWYRNTPKTIGISFPQRYIPSLIDWLQRVHAARESEGE